MWSRFGFPEQSEGSRSGLPIVLQGTGLNSRNVPKVAEITHKLSWKCGSPYCDKKRLSSPFCCDDNRFIAYQLPFTIFHYRGERAGA
jgi:hypothetical protein